MKNQRVAFQGRVLAFHATGDVLFSAGEDRAIKGWKFVQETKLFDAAVRLVSQICETEINCREVLAQATAIMRRFNASLAYQFFSFLAMPMVPLLYGT